jgi:hypothetical protein
MSHGYCAARTFGKLIPCPIFIIIIITSIIIIIIRKFNAIHCDVMCKVSEKKADSTVTEERRKNDDYMIQMSIDQLWMRRGGAALKTTVFVMRPSLRLGHRHNAKDECTGAKQGSLLSAAAGDGDLCTCCNMCDFQPDHPCQRM